ncbi:MAG: sigma 54-interacting transcriptional regulator, partial [Spirochaetes bacterium]|nr:sigma 54-interacting transcriptional regulator [Spirochaetota bacterium]
TLFLDEINSMSLPLQAKILRALQECSVRRLGGLKDLFVDVRIIAASNEPLHAMMKAGAFRKDLYYRVNVMNVQIPALRDRREDIPLLTDHFIRHYSGKLGKDVWMPSPELERAFKDYAWVGNVRELQNVIESAMAMVSDENVLGVEHLPPHVDLLERQERARPPESFEGDLAAYLERVERAILEDCMSRSGGNVSKAARLAGVSRQSLQYKLKRLGVPIVIP